MKNQNIFSIQLKILLALSYLCLVVGSQALWGQEQYFQYQPLQLEFSTKATSETAAENPFMDYRLQVEFSQGDRSFSVPGFYAADGNSAQTSSESGGLWRVFFTPPSSGVWNYKVSFRKGHQIAISDDPYRGLAIRPHDGKQGSLSVNPIPSNAAGFAKSGRLQYNGTRYLHTEDGQAFLKFGANSPENFLACADIDGTYSYDPEKDFLKTWEPHAQDWKVGDPLWQGKGKGIIGALNYLAAQNMNVAYILTQNIEGDARDVWPFLSHEKKDFQRYDVSKLAQWDIIFSHAEQLGIIMHLITQEKENELVLDDGNTGLERKLYYRELIARFAYHNNIIWNMGEENGPAPGFWPQGQNDQQRFAMIRYLKDHDPYKNPLVIHTMSERAERTPIIEPLLAFDRLDGLSMQVSNVHHIHHDIKDWIDRSQKRNRPWIVMMDEIGPWHTGTRSDTEDPDHDTLRQEVLWGTLMAGGAGVEWYFGWFTPPNDLNAQDWRSRENMWKQSAIAHDFFKQIPYTAMLSSDHLVDNPDAYCFSKSEEVYVVYLKKGGTSSLDLSDSEGDFQIQWYDPKIGGELQTGSLSIVKGGAWQGLGTPPSKPNQDWIALIKK